MPHTINFRLVRGLDYYTKTVFEVWAEGIGAQAAVCGGGRYDRLIEELGGPPTPGIGFGMGIERVIASLKAQGVQPPALPAPRVQVSPLGERPASPGIKLVRQLREADIGALLAFGGRSLKSQLKSADKAERRYTLILGRVRSWRRTRCSYARWRPASRRPCNSAEIVNWLRGHLGLGVRQDLIHARLTAPASAC